MDISQHRQVFSVFVVDSDFSAAQSLAELLKASGFEDTNFFPTLESALAMARQNPPHLVLFDYERQEAAAEGFLMELRTISPEILTVLMIAYRQTLASLQMMSRGLAYDGLVRPFVSTLEIIQKLDRAATRLYFQFATEQLQDELSEMARGEAIGAAAGTLSAASQAPSNQSEGQRDGQQDGQRDGRREHQSSPALGHSAAPSANAETVGDETIVNDYLGRLSGAKDLDQTIQVFMDAMSLSLGKVPVLYFRYVASHISLLISQAAWLPVEKFRGIGVDLRKENPSRLPSLFRDPTQLAPLRTLMSQVFRSETFSAFPHYNEGETLGIFVILESVDVDDSKSRLMAFRRGFELAYKRNLTIKEKHALDITDAATSLMNRKHFSLKLDEEISRSRRILLPVSLITVDVDGIHKLNEKLGLQQTDSILRAIALILKKTARANDIIARTGPDEFVCLLPHTGHMGGAVKAERVRRIIESTRFPILESLALGPVTLSCGVSEYPSFCNDADGLLRSADEALVQVKNSGGNKVCLASAPPGFQIDFTPRDASSGPPVKSGVVEKREGMR